MVQLRFRPAPEWPAGVVPLGLGLGVGSLMVVLSLGLRAPVLLGAVVPPLVAGRFWWRRQDQLTKTAIANGSILDPWVLRQRMRRLQLPVHPGATAPRRWKEISAELEAIRECAARCAELDASSAVSLLLLLEGLLDRIPPCANPDQQRAGELVRHLQACRLHLAGMHDEALRWARQHPRQPILLPPLPPRFLP